MEQARKALAEGKSQTAVQAGLRSRLIAAPKPIEELPGFLRRDCAAAVGYLQEQLASSA